MTRKPGRTVRPGRDCGVTWKYLVPNDWTIVHAALNYYLSTFVSDDARRPIEHVRDSLQNQEPTV